MYRLRCELRGHEEDVRCVCNCEETTFATGSRDKTVRIWDEDASGSISLVKTLVGHSAFVSAVAWVAPGLLPEFPNGAVVSGSMDTRIIVWDISTATPAMELKGHTYQVTSLAVTATGDIVSGSLDKTVRVWSGGECVQVLEGHEGPVQTVVVLPTGGILSGAGDCMIKLWQGNKCTHTIQGHTDTVRGLGLVPDLGVVSASHDTTVRLWSFQGDELAVMDGHSSLVYAAAASSSGVIASASEDKSAKIWQADGMCLQTIEHARDVWDVAFLPCGDLVTACADHVARVWTKDASRCASDDVVAAFESGVVAQKADSAGAGGGGGLPDGLSMEDPSALLAPGTPGQTKIIREGGGGWAYTWDANKQEWEKIGQVVDGPGDVGVDSKTLHGVRYDWVFDVDIADGEPPRKLPFNRGQNPYEVAERWLADEELPLTYREQVVNFIVQNTGGGAAAHAPPSYNVDPFTGGGSYVPGGAPAAAASMNAPTFAGATGGGVDPFTGGAPTSAAAPRALAYCPMRTLLSFDAAQVDGIQRKLAEFSGSGAVPGELALTEHEAGQVLPGIAGALADKGSYATAQLPAEALALVEKLLRWPAAQLFPVLDLVRILALHGHAASHLASSSGPLLMDAVQRAAAAGLAPNLLTAARLVANAFKGGGLLAWAVTGRADLLDALASCAASPNKNVRTALATALLNVAVVCTEGADEEGRTQCLSAAVELLSVPGAEEEPEAAFRALVAVGTVVHGDADMAGLARDMGAGDLAARASSSGVTKLAGAGADVAQLLRGGG